MTLTKVTLGFTGIVFAAYGLWCAIDPNVVAGYSGLVYGTPGAATEVRAMYGGLEAGFGLFLLYALVKPALQEPALLVTLFVVGGLALCRTLGVAIEGLDSYNSGALILEASITALSAASLILERRAAAPAAA